MEEFHARRPSALLVLAERAEILGGFIAIYQDPAALNISVMDQPADGLGT